jgi:hypothetical protein
MLTQRILGHGSAAMMLDVCADLFDIDLDSVPIRLDNRYSRREAQCGH